MMYLSKPVYPIFSVILRYSVLIVLLIMSLGLYFGILGGTPVIELYRNIFELINIGWFKLSVFELLMNILIIAIIVLSIIPRNNLFVGIGKTIHYYVFIILILSLVSTILLPAEKFNVWRYTVLFTSIFVLNTILWLKYPFLIISVSKVNEDKDLEEPVHSADPIRLKPGEAIHVDVIGDHRNIDVKYDENYIRVDSRETLLGLTLVVKPLSITPSRVEIYYKNRLVSYFNIRLEETSSRKIEFNIVFNGDPLGSETYSVEETKTLLEAAQPAIRSAMARLGVELEDIREVQFYDPDDKILNPDIMVYSIPYDKVTVKIYTVEKHLEILRYYKEEDVYRLWSKLMKRLEYLDTSVGEMLSKIHRELSYGRIVVQNWW